MIHPGPRASERVRSRRATLCRIEGVLPAGLSVMEAVDDLFNENNCKGGVIFLNGICCDPMRFVLPASSTDGLHAAWYSDTYAPDGRWTVQSATATVGQKDGATFLHCHGIWSDARETAMGHLLPLDTVLAEDAHVTGLGSPDGWFEALPDSETAFTLFTAEGGDKGPAVFARILPGEDVVTAIETLAAQYGIKNADLYAVGSIDHINFTDGSRMECHATELHFHRAEIVDGTASVMIEAVDISGNIARGTLDRGNNPVGVTLELIIDPERKVHG